MSERKFVATRIVGFSSRYEVPMHQASAADGEFTMIRVPGRHNADALELTIKSRKSKRERKIEALEVALAGAPHDREWVGQLLDALEAIDREET